MSKITKFKYWFSQKKTQSYQKWIYFYYIFEIKKKSITLLELAINVLITGLVIWYALNYKNFLSYGLASALIMYYISWLIKEIKSKENN